MPFILHNEGAEAFLKTYFQGTTVAQRTTWYMGLGYDTLVKGDSIAQIAGEPSGNGYARQAFTANPTNCPVAADGTMYQVLFAEQTFTASGGAWSTVNLWFLCTVVSGSSGLLIASCPLRSPYAVPDLGSLKESPYIILGSAD
jgi:hypothetical protein